MTTSRFSSLLLLLIIIIIIIFTTAIVAYSSEEEECVYIVYVKTGDAEKAGTDSKISFSVGDYTGQSVSVDNLKEWGIMGRGHNYFEKGQVDIFVGRAKCLSSSICKLRLASNGKGILPAWLVESVQVIFTGFLEPCSELIFSLDRWLSLEPHGELSVEVDMCNPLFPYLPWSAYNNKGGKMMMMMMMRKGMLLAKPKPLMSIASASGAATSNQ